MKAMYVPFTKVSIDSEIQRMRDMFTSSEDLEIDTDGTISRLGSTKDTAAEPKAKTVPKTIVSVSDEGRSVQDLIKEMRGEDETFNNPRNDNVLEGDSENKTTIVPKGIVSTSVSDLINEMRETETDNADTERLLPNDDEDGTAEPKAKIVPKGIVS